MEFGDKSKQSGSKQQYSSEFQELQDASFVVRRRFLRDILGFGAAAFGAATFGLNSEVAASSRTNSSTINARSLGISSRARTDIQKCCNLVLEAFSQAYGVDEKSPFEFKDGVTTVSITSDELRVMPEKASIPTVTSPTKTGQLFGVMTALYTALHCNGKDGIEDKDTYKQAYEGMRGNSILIRNAVTVAKNHLVHAMKLNAGIFQDQNEARNARALLLQAQQGFQAEVKNIVDITANSGNRFTGDYTKTAQFRISKILEFVAKNVPRVNKRDSQSAFDNLDKVFDILIKPEILIRAINFSIAGTLPNRVSIGGDFDNIFKARTKLASSAKVYNMFFPGVDLPSVSTFIPFKDNAVPEFRVHYANENKTYCIPINVACEINGDFESKIPNLTTFRGRVIDFDEMLPDGADLYNGLVSAFNLSVGLSKTLVDAAQLDRGVNLAEKVRNLGVSIITGAPRDDEDSGVLLKDNAPRNSISGSWRIA